MIDDIFSAQLNFEDPSGPSSIKFYFQQTADNGLPSADVVKLAEAIDANLTADILAALSDDFWFASIVCRKHYEDPQAQVTHTPSAQAGLASGPGLPSNCCVNFGLQQTLFANNRNGRVFFPGIPEVETNTGILDPAYQSGALTDIADTLVTVFNAPADTGVYELGMISQKALNVAPPAKDWPGAFAFVNTISVSPVIAIQRRRTTKVIGGVV